MCAACAAACACDDRERPVKGNKMRRMMSVVVAVVALVIAGAAVDRVDGDGFAYWDPADSGNGHFYELVTPANGIRWTAAEIASEGRTMRGVPGHLATVASEEENAFIVELVQGNLTRWYTWIGLTDRRTEGLFEWVTAEPLQYSNWDSNEPNDYTGDEEYAIIRWDTTPVGRWNDLWDTSVWVGTPLSYVVEYPTEGISLTPPMIARSAVVQDCGSLGCLAFDVDGFFASDGFTIDPLDPVIDGTNISLDIFAYSPGGTPDEVITPFSSTACFGPLADGLYRDSINLYVDGELVDTLTGSFVVPIPEPTSMLILALGSTLILARRR